MCIDPASAMMVVGSTLSAGSQIMGGINAARQAKEAARISRENAKTRLLKGAYEAGQISDREERISGAAQAHFAGSGLDATSGSPLLLQMFSAEQAETDRSLVRAGAFSEAGNHYEMAAAQRERGRQARISSIFGAASSLLMGASKWKGLEGGSGGMFSFQPAYKPPTGQVPFDWEG